MFENQFLETAMYLSTPLEQDLNGLDFNENPLKLISFSDLDDECTENMQSTFRY